MSAFRSCKLTGAAFEEVSYLGLSFEHSLLIGADLRGADLGGLKLVNAKLFAGATISPRQAAELVRATGLNVA